MATPCTAQKRDGSPCPANAMTGKILCFGHDPDQVEARRARSAQGGRNRSTVIRAEKNMPPSMRTVLATLLHALEGLKEGTIDPRQGAAIASVAAACCKVWEVSELDARIKNLEGEHEQGS